MPVFEYICHDCSKKFVILVGMTADSSISHCPTCNSNNITKLISRFSHVRGESEKLEDLEDAAFSNGMDDPKTMTRLVKEMSKEIGEDAGNEFDEYLEEAEKEICDCDASL